MPDLMSQICVIYPRTSVKWSLLLSLDPVYKSMPAHMCTVPSSYQRVMRRRGLLLFHMPMRQFN